MHSGRDDDDDRPPPAKSARARPSQSRRDAHLPGVRKAKRVDPRFDPMFGSAADPKHFQRNYQFLLDQQAEEEEQRRSRIRRLKCVLRRHEIEEARIEKARTEREQGGKNNRSGKRASTAEEDEEDEDLSEYEREVFGEEHLQELRALKLTPPQHIYRELEQLQRECQLYVSRTKNTAALSRRDQVKREIMKKEVRAVKDGAKAKPFFPKRSAVKRAVLSDTFDRLEAKGGKDAVDRYVARKIKR